MEEKQITNDLSYHHDLDNNDNFSPDGEWLVYDTRTDSGGIAASSKIEKVNILTGEKRILYEIKNNQVWGPGAGAVSYNPKENSVVFIHGLASSSEANPYQQWRRTGVIVQDSDPNVPIFMDARDMTFPYTPGALRGGTHRHEWSGNGQWIGFTYNDAIMKALEDSTGTKQNLRTIGVSKKIKPVIVDQNSENISGTWFSALVVRVVPEPTPGTDEISNAAGDSWVGQNGYINKVGKRQIARAFLGTVPGQKNKAVPEVFIVDIPEDITQPGEHGPLEGTKTTLPMPPKGTLQRRLTYTANSEKPGCSGIVRSSPDGGYLAFMAFDKNGIQQVFIISPNGGKPVQLTEHGSDVSGNIRWHPDGQRVSYVWNGSYVLCKLGNYDFKERFEIITKPTNPAPTNAVWSPNGKTIAFNRLIKNGKDSAQQIFVREIN
ncbi:DUF3748 domain-containing protein [Dyadobacter sp. NIV53]|uniref:DUF3748 domain-containing protein n=1 Tax=Dyadobacter sp. NIV53 TaxID=2861765 RepID=UPI001E64D5C4|nr:DUF3748 domain-containing protein [Dyadobacter sp. NIV53]